MTTAMYRMGVLLTGVGIGVFASSCKQPNDDHCWHADGDTTCQKRYGDEKPFCESAECSMAADFGCVAEKPEPECYSPCGGEKTSLEEEVCSDVANDGDDVADTGDGMASTTMADTQGDGMDSTTMADPCAGCPEGLCVDDACQQCVNDVDVSACDASHPICDDTTYTCEKCTNHHQCPGDAGCHILAGTCLPPDDDLVIHVGIGQEQTSIPDAFAALGDKSGTLIVHASAQDYLVGNSIKIAPGQVVAVVAQGDRPTVAWDEAVDNGEVNRMFIVADGHLYLERINLRGESGIRNGRDGVTYAEAVNIRTSSSAILMDDNNDLVESTGSVHLYNSMLSSENADMVPTMWVKEGTFTSAFSTLVSGTAPALYCDPGCPTCGAVIRNSILGRSDNDVALDCDGAQVTTSTEVQNMLPDWFGDITEGNLHLTANGKLQFATGAQWTDADPAVDYDDEARPQDSAIPGADVP